MTRALFFLLFLTMFSLASLWFVDNDGNVIVEWMGYRIQTSVAFAILFFIIILVACTLFLQIILWIKSAPKRYRKQLKDRKLSRGLTALTQGFAAIAAGDTKQARALSAKASSNLDNMPLTKLLAAQTAQLEGNRELAQQHYTSMLDNKETEIIAIKGLLIEAKQDSDLAKALFLAEKAYKLRPDADWVILIMFDLYKKLRKWPEAIEMTGRVLKKKLINREDADRIIGLISFAQYQEHYRLGNNYGDDYIKNAYKFVPDFAPIVAAYARNLVEHDKTRKALKILENQWINTPYPDLAAAYMDIYGGETDAKRLEKAEMLLELCNGHPEGHVLVATIALESGQFTKARHHLKIALDSGETKAICNLMAELESMERAGHEAIHYWRERAGYANEFALWKCVSCGTKSKEWSITCNNCNSFDSMVWRDTQIAANIIKPENLLSSAN